MLSRLAPAKINFCLRVLGRRLDGYHELDSLILPLALCDEVRLDLTLDRTMEVSCRCPGHPELEGEGNLAARAARAYLEAAGRRARVELEIDKRIWVAAGLGGGSSDAAAVLRILDEATSLLPPAALATLAASLGADVPFFLGRGPARARGRGERLDPLPPLPKLDVVLCNPGAPLATPAVYQALGLAPGASTSRQPIDEARLGRLPDGLLELCENDLGPAAERLCPTVTALRRELLAAGARVACVTGSGPTVFGVFGDPASARAAARKLGNLSRFSVLETTTVNA
jgi:4-diphosphocytidyl-2-C-methyl-D-erythritol kinase